MTPDVPAQNFMGNIGASTRSENFRHSSADIGLRVDKCASTSKT